MTVLNHSSAGRYSMCCMHACIELVPHHQCKCASNQTSMDANECINCQPKSIVFLFFWVLLTNIICMFLLPACMVNQYCSENHNHSSAGRYSAQWLSDLFLFILFYEQIIDPLLCVGGPVTSLWHVGPYPAMRANSGTGARIVASVL